MKRRILAIVLPRWQADCARKLAYRQDGKRPRPNDESAPPLLVICTEHGTRIVRGCCAQATRRGVYVGITLAHARALCPPPIIEVESQPEREVAMLRAVARWCQRYAPITALEPSAGPVTILVDITGCERVHRSDTDLLRRVVDELSARGVHSRVAIAPTAVAAVALAQSAKKNLLDCPVRALRIDGKAVTGLLDVNVRTIGELLALPRPSIAQRYGAEVLHRIDMALGDAFETLTPVRSNPLPTAERIFDGPVSNLEAIALTAMQLIEGVCASLRERDRGGCEFELTALCADAPTYRHRVILGTPNARAAHLVKILAPHIERIPMGMGVESMRLSVLRMGRFAGSLDGTRGGTTSAALRGAVGEWVDTLTAQLGDRSVFRGGFVEHHQPERSSRWIPVARHGLSTRNAWRDANVRAVEAWRPSSWCERPEPIIVESPHTPTIRWRTQEQRITQWIGPERIATPCRRAGEETVDGRMSNVDYWRIELEQGTWLWIAHDARGWSLVGLWS